MPFKNLNRIWIVGRLVTARSGMTGGGTTGRRPMKSYACIHFGLGVLRCDG
jgi:hypothetical protein